MACPVIALPWACHRTRRLAALLTLPVCHIGGAVHIKAINHCARGARPAGVWARSGLQGRWNHFYVDRHPLPPLRPPAACQRIIAKHLYVAPLSSTSIVAFPSLYSVESKCELEAARQLVPIILASRYRAASQKSAEFAFFCSYGFNSIQRAPRATAKNQPLGHS